MKEGMSRMNKIKQLPTVSSWIIYRKKFQFYVGNLRVTTLWKVYPGKPLRHSFHDTKKIYEERSEEDSFFSDDFSTWIKFLGNFLGWYEDSSGGDEGC